MRLIADTIDRDLWLAAEIDSVEGRVEVAMLVLNRKFDRALWALMMVLASTIASTLTMLVTNF